MREPLVSARHVRWLPTREERQWPVGNTGDSKPALLEGVISIEAALRNESRSVYQLLLDRNGDNKKLIALARQAERSNVPIRLVAREVIDDVAEGRTHGGAVAYVGPRHFVALTELLSKGPTFIVMLDGVEDPYNFGSALRSLFACGAQGLLVRPRNWLSAASVVARSSAGASEVLPAAICESVAEAAQHCHEQGIASIVLDQKAPLSLSDADLTRPILVVVGGEQRGVTRSFRSSETTYLRIPYAADVKISLGTAASAAIVGYEVMRQRTAIFARS